MMAHDYDVVIVGAGFAGVTAARELATRGYRTVVLEGRDRIGGRSGSRRMADGTPADVGGTFVHWSQPHTWAEITRYGLTDEVVPGIAPLDWVATLAGGEVTWSRHADLEAFTRRAYAKVMADSATVFPNPSAPLQAREEVVSREPLSVAEALRHYDLTEAEYAALAATFASYAGRPQDEAGWLGVLRMFALGNDNYADLMDMMFTWKLKNGTGSLLDAMIADGGAEVRLDITVTGVASSESGVRVTLKDGSVVTGAACVIATPANVWPHLDLTPALPAAQLRAAQEGMAAAESGKGVALIQGEHRSLQFVGDRSAPFSFFTAQLRPPDRQVIALYTPGRAFDVSDPALVKATIERALPHVTVLDSIGDMYLSSDPMFRGAWGFLARGQLSEQVPHESFTRLDERVVFATTDIARLFHGVFFDGAIESGLRAAREVRASLAGPGR